MATEITLADILALVEGSVWSEIKYPRDSIYEAYKTQKGDYIFVIKFSQGIGPIDPRYELKVKKASTKRKVISFDEKPWGELGPIKQLFKRAKESWFGLRHEIHNRDVDDFGKFFHKEMSKR